MVGDCKIFAPPSATISRPILFVYPKKEVLFSLASSRPDFPDGNKRHHNLEGIESGALSRRRHADEKGTLKLKSLPRI